jgi:tRNA dimethylallyltransferase
MPLAYTHNGPNKTEVTLTQPCLCITGPTASGKTRLALQLQEKLAPGIKLEIISVDSALVYRGMDIGTAKPTAQERAQLPHHLIDILDPTEAYSAARFVQDAQALAAAIRKRGCVPLLLGGTMLYFKALFQGLDEMPPSSPAVRQILQQQLQSQGLTSLYAELQQHDPVLAQRLPPGDTQRIMRGLEVFLLTGRPLSGFHTRHQEQAPHQSRVEWPILSMEPALRSQLHERIALRFQGMMKQGFMEEMQQLRQNPHLHADLPSIRCVGYRQAWQAMDAAALTGKPIDEAWVEQAIAATRQLAKRQLTWLKSMPHRTILDGHAENPETLHKAMRWFEQAHTA